MPALSSPANVRGSVRVTVPGERPLPMVPDRCSGEADDPSGMCAGGQYLGGNGKIVRIFGVWRGAFAS